MADRVERHREIIRAKTCSEDTICGICGIVDFDSAPEESTLDEMVATLRHRGPDGNGVHVAGPVGLGHTRLSIVDLSETGRQPMTRDGVVMVYNGELYNSHALRGELEALGHQFRGTSDSEVLLAAFNEWGTAVFPRLNGMYAAAFWDGRRLTLVRDRFGIKPLFIARTARGLVFGSEPKAILAAERTESRLDYAALHEFLYYGTALGKRTLFADIQCVLPGHAVVFDVEGARVHQYWDPATLAPQFLGVDGAIEGVRDRLDTAVSDHLMSDVPVGVFLSGGIDSSAIAILAAKHYGGRLQTFTAGFDFAGAVDEMPQARALAKELGTDHHELRVTGGDLAAVIEKLVIAHDQPFSDAANIPLYLLCEAVGSSVKVILQGDGGDEIFAGYRRYAQTTWSRSLRALSRGRRLIVGEGIHQDRALKMLDAFALRDPALRIAAITTQERLGRPLEVLAPGVRSRVEASDPFARFREVVESLHHLGPVQQHLYADAQILLPDVFLEKVDKPTMAHSVEIRVPMLDANLASFAMALPAGYKVRRNQKKWVLRQALRGIVPAHILDAPKQGFGVPYADWLRTSLRPWMQEVLFDSSFADWGVVDPKALQSTVDDHVSGRRNRGFFLYKMVNLALWKDRYGVSS